MSKRRNVCMKCVCTHTEDTDIAMIHKNVSNGRLISIIVVITMMITIATEVIGTMVFPAWEHIFPPSSLSSSSSLPSISLPQKYTMHIECNYPSKFYKIHHRHNQMKIERKKKIGRMWVKKTHAEEIKWKIAKKKRNDDESNKVTLNIYIYKKNRNSRQFFKYHTRFKCIHLQYTRAWLQPKPIADRNKEKKRPKHNYQFNLWTQCFVRFTQTVGDLIYFQLLPMCAHFNAVPLKLRNFINMKSVKRRKCLITDKLFKTLCYDLCIRRINAGDVWSTGMQCVLCYFLCRILISTKAFPNKYKCVCVYGNKAAHFNWADTKKHESIC